MGEGCSNEGFLAREKIQEAGSGKILCRGMDGAFLADDSWSSAKLSGTLVLQATWPKVVIRDSENTAECSHPWINLQRLKCMKQIEHKGFFSFTLSLNHVFPCIVTYQTILSVLIPGIWDVCFSLCHMLWFRLQLLIFYQPQTNKFKPELRETRTKKRNLCEDRFHFKGAKITQKYWFYVKYWASWEEILNLLILLIGGQRSGSAA